jgi:hypothetical protein
MTGSRHQIFIAVDGMCKVVLVTVSTVEPNETCHLDMYA